jgi:SAM-dependent methyltransferase
MIERGFLPANIDMYMRNDDNRPTPEGTTPQESRSLPSSLRLPGNRAVYEKFVEFSTLLDDIRNRTPLTPPHRYYPYGTIHIIPQILPVLDDNGIDLKAHVENKSILDLGCGDGELSFFYESLGAKHLVAIDKKDFNGNHLEGFRALRTVLGSRVELIDADVHRMNFADLPPLDSVFCFGFLYHSPHPFWILENLARSCQTLFLTTKVFDCDKPYAYFYDVAECNGDASNWWCFTTEALMLMLKRAGFGRVCDKRLDPHVGNSDPVDAERDGRIFVLAVERRADLANADWTLNVRSSLEP